MRKKFKLPENNYCCGSATVTDCLSWQFCWPCALSQEVRTAKFYNVGNEEVLYINGGEDEEGGEQIGMVPLAREGGIPRSNSSPAKTSDDLQLGHAYFSSARTYVEPDVMIPPAPQMIQLGNREGGL